MHSQSNALVIRAPDKASARKPIKDVADDSLRLTSRLGDSAFIHALAIDDFPPNVINQRAVVWKSDSDELFKSGWHDFESARHGLLEAKLKAHILTPPKNFLRLPYNLEEAR